MTRLYLLLAIFFVMMSNAVAFGNLEYDIPSESLQSVLFEIKSKIHYQNRVIQNQNNVIEKQGNLIKEMNGIIVNLNHKLEKQENKMDRLESEISVMKMKAKLKPLEERQFNNKNIKHDVKTSHLKNSSTSEDINIQSATTKNDDESTQSHDMNTRADDMGSIQILVNNLSQTVSSVSADVQVSFSRFVINFDSQSSIRIFDDQLLIDLL